MTFKEFLKDKEWDAPFFKRLSHNDTGCALGHQGGPALPVSLRQYLPVLNAKATLPTHPTVDRKLQATMFNGVSHLATDDVRYQIQTWAGTRSPESRITDGYGPIHSISKANDILVIQRRADSVDAFRLILVKKGTREYAEISTLIDGRKCGALSLNNIPVTQAQLTKAQADILKLASTPFMVQVPVALRLVTKQSRLARSTAFREQVRRVYKNKCAVSGVIIATPNKLYEVESAHIIPISEKGPDEIRNGFTLMQSLHWAFDEGLFGVKQNRSIYIPKQVKRRNGNDFLKQFEGQRILEAADANLRAHPDAFLWHLENRVKKWE